MPPLKKAKPPQRYLKVKRKYPRVFQAYERFGEELSQTGPLSARERELVRLGAAIGAGLESAVRAHVRRGRASGLSANDLTHAALLSATTVGFPRMMAALRWVEETR